MRKLGVLVCAGLIGVAGPAAAKRTGIVTKSGQNNGAYCTDCHTTSGNKPTVELSGPTEVEGGETSRYSFTITPNSASHTACGLDVSADGGVLDAVSDGTQATSNAGGFQSDEDEITHTSPISLTDGKVIVEFDWTAPKKSGTFKLYAAGNAVNDSFWTDGDYPATTTLSVEVTCPDEDGDGYFDSKVCPDEAKVDCNDADGDVHPDAEEVCNAKDDNCNKLVDDGINPDADGDGFSPPAPESTCETGNKPLTDCDDTNAAVRPGRTEICNGVDDNCDGMFLADEHDDDGDTYLACRVGTRPADCADDDDTRFPGAPETCGDTIDQDCNGSDLVCECPDADKDGEKDAACGGLDCNDADAAINPDAEEQCDSVDHDCDGEPHNGLDFDRDEDGHNSLDSCNEPSDCDDFSNSVNPEAEEICGNEVDDDCDGMDEECPACMPEETRECYEGSAATKGKGVCKAGVESCADGDWAGTCAGQVLPAAEVCDNSLDDDCDGETDEDCMSTGGSGGSAGSGGSGGTTGSGGSGGKTSTGGGDEGGGGCNAAGGTPALLLLVGVLLVLRRRR